MHNGAFQRGVVADTGVGAYDAVLAENVAGRQVAVVTDDGRTAHLRCRVDLGSFAQPHSWAQGEPTHLHCDLLVEHVLVCTQIGVERPPGAEITWRPGRLADNEALDLRFA